MNVHTLGLTIFLLIELGSIQKTWASARIINPGKNVGKITASTTYDELVKMFKKRNVSIRPIWNGDSSEEDSGEQLAVVLFADLPKKKLILNFEKKQNEKKVLTRLTGGIVEYCYGDFSKKPTSSEWKTKQGVFLGMSLKEVEKLNGRPFKLFGFESHFHGQVSSWNGGKLAKFENVRVTFTAPIDPEQKIYERVLGNEVFDSSNSAMQSINPVICYFSFDL